MGLVISSLLILGPVTCSGSVIMVESATLGVWACLWRGLAPPPFPGTGLAISWKGALGQGYKEMHRDSFLD